MLDPMGYSPVAIRLISSLATWRYRGAADAVPRFRPSLVFRTVAIFADS
jgi:hypothetical protein